MLKRAFVFLFSIALLFGAASMVQAQDQEVIRSFDARAHLAQDRTVTIEEKIAYDFGSGTRHGIFRMIPEIYDRNGGSYRLRLHVDGVRMDGAVVPYTVQPSGRYVEIKIGDPNRVVHGLHTYMIRYATDRSINDFADHTEWYWNVTGTDWPVTIEKASVLVEAPSSTRRQCFVGAFGVQEGACGWLEQADGVRVTATRVLPPYEGMTVVFAFPQGSFVTRSGWWYLMQFFADNIWLGLPIVTFFLMWAIWYRWGKEPRGRGTIIPQYEEPRALPPGLQLALLSQRLPSRAVTATILDLARRGYLKIKWDGEDASDVVFIQEKKADGGVHAFEKEILAGLFGPTRVIVRPSELRETFYEAIEKSRHAAFGELQAYKWLLRDPVFARSLWMFLAIGVAVIGIAFFNAYPVQLLALLMSAFIIAAFGWQMPQMTKEGAVVCEEIEGFKLFLSVTEEKRLAFSDAPDRKPEQFARFLPAAVAFGVEKMWARQFADMMVPPPSYIDGAWNGWNAMQMANAMNDLHHSSATGLYTAPSSAGSGGSGFSGGGSGGGFGGGGGGSW